MEEKLQQEINQKPQNLSKIFDCTIQRQKINELTNKIHEKIDKDPVKINNFNDLLLKEYLKSKENNKLTYKFLILIECMITNIMNQKTYYIEKEREICKALAFKDVLEYWKNFNPEKSKNIFSYFISIILNGAAKGWKLLHGLQKGFDQSDEIATFENLLDLLEQNIIE